MKYAPIHMDLSKIIGGGYRTQSAASYHLAIRQFDTTPFWNTRTLYTVQNIL